MRCALVLVGLLSACGARTDLHAPMDAAMREAVPDAAISLDAHVVIDAPTTRCMQGVLTEFPTAECGGNEVDWFATPYTPPADITVDRLEAFMAHGHVALLASAGGMPGAVLFTGAVGTSPMRVWTGASVSPPVSLVAGTPYFIGFQGSCSFASGGPEPVEYMAPSVDGPWHFQGADNWTARLIGTCP